MRISVCVCMYVCIFVCMYVCSTYVCMYLSYVRIGVCMYACMVMCVCVCVCLCVCQNLAHDGISVTQTTVSKCYYVIRRYVVLQLGGRLFRQFEKRSTDAP
jgi:hypothetical protein